MFKLKNLPRSASALASELEFNAAGGEVLESLISLSTGFKISFSDFKGIACFRGLD
jgi:hypothetical protein